MINNKNSNTGQIQVSKITIWLPDGVSKDHWIHRIQYFGGNSSFQSELTGTPLAGQPLGKTDAKMPPLLLANDP